jgi:hypothetical protein
MAITKRQFETANKRGEAAIARGPVARAARYDARRALIVVSLEGGCEIAFPVSLIEGLTDASRTKLSRIAVSPNGLALHWLGGASRSAAKKKASRENGKRGGRPVAA